MVIKSLKALQVKILIKEVVNIQSKGMMKTLMLQMRSTMVEAEIEDWTRDYIIRTLLKLPWIKGPSSINSNRDYLLFFSESYRFHGTQIGACHAALLTSNSQLHVDSLDDNMCGTTVITVLIRGRAIYVANSGDPRAVTVERKGKEIVAVDLSNDRHHPCRLLVDDMSQKAFPEF